MTQLINDCFGSVTPLMTAGEALGLLEERLHPITGAEMVPLSDAAGRILAENVYAKSQVPAFDNAAVDGYAFRFCDLNSTQESLFKVAGRVAAGHPVFRKTSQQEAWQIFTGAPIPPGLDTVIMQEDCNRRDDQLFVPTGIKKGMNVRAAGEDLASGELVFSKGQRMQAQHIGQLASISCERLSIYRRLKVALFSTGDEIRDIGSKLEHGCIFDSNRYSISALLEKLGCEVKDLGILPDRRATIETELVQAASDCDVVMTSAGVSAGEEDHVKTSVENLGSLYFWRLAIKPGRPLALGQIGTTPFIGLPGNPVAVMVTFMQFARPTLLLLGGATEVRPLTFRVPAFFSYTKKGGRREWLRASLKVDEEGIQGAEKFSKEGAGILSSMVASDGLLELPEELTEIRPGTVLNFLPFSEVS